MNTDTTIVNRVVAFLTPVFAGLSGYVVQWVAVHFPGTPQLNKNDLTALFGLGAAAGAAAALKFLHNLHDWQARKAGLKAPAA